MLTVQELANKLADRLSGGILSRDTGTEHRLFCSISPDQLVSAVDFIFNQLGGRLIASAGTDKVPISGKYEVSYLFSFDRDDIVLSLKVEVDPSDPVLDSITPLIPGANWTERELMDMIGIFPRNHPDPRRLLLADDWPEEVHPLRRDVPHDFRPPPAEGVAPPVKEAPENATVVSVGPFYPSLEEPAYFRLFVEGETVVGCDYRGFYSHRGIEKLCDTVLTYNQIPFLAERICGICGFVHSCCYCQAVESAGDIHVPLRARYIRTFMLELERIHSHLLWLGIAAHIVGFDTVLMQSWRVREPVMWLCEEITGNRKTYGMNLVGGVRRDIPEETKPRILEVLNRIEEQCKPLVKALLGDTSLLVRLEGVGKLSKDAARELCVVGPTARASGLKIDTRLDHPYGVYSRMEFNVPVRTEGDVLARTLIRLDELFESIKIAKMAIQYMPEGRIMADVKEIPPWREGIALVEAPRGECCHYVVTGPGNRPYRWRVRASTYPQLQAIPTMMQDCTVADASIIIGSIDPCFSCTERLETVDLKSRLRKVYSREELIVQAQEKYGGGK